MRIHHSAPGKTLRGAFGLTLLLTFTDRELPDRTDFGNTGAPGGGSGWNKWNHRLQPIQGANGHLIAGAGSRSKMEVMYQSRTEKSFNYTDPESLSARLTIGAFERYTIGQSFPYPSPPSPSPSPPSPSTFTSPSPTAYSPSPFLSGLRDYRLQSLLSFHLFNLSDPLMKCSGVCRARFGTNLLIER
jgi:hypothetical protein